MKIVCFPLGSRVAVDYSICPVATETFSGSSRFECQSNGLSQNQSISLFFASLSFYFRPKQGTLKWTRKGWQLLIVQAENGFFKKATNTLTPAWQSRNCYSTADYEKVAIRCKVSIKNAERIACENRVGLMTIFRTKHIVVTFLKQLFAKRLKL